MQATFLTFALILYPVVNFLEAWLEQTVIDLKNPYIKEYDKLNHREHFRSGVFAVAVCLILCCVAASLGHYWLLPAVALNRRLVFDYALKILRERPFYRYEGDGIFDTIGRKIFGRDGAENEFFVLLIITVISIYLTVVNALL